MHNKVRIQLRDAETISIVDACKLLGNLRYVNAYYKSVQFEQITSQSAQSRVARCEGRIRANTRQGRMQRPLPRPRLA